NLFDLLEGSLRKPSQHVLVISALSAHPALVTGLFFRCSPSAVRRFVVSIIINAVNAVFRRGSRSHVGKKIREGGPPAAASRGLADILGATSRTKVFQTHSRFENPRAVFCCQDGNGRCRHPIFRVL